MAEKAPIDIRTRQPQSGPCFWLAPHGSGRCDYRGLARDGSIGAVNVYWLNRLPSNATNPQGMQGNPDNDRCVSAADPTLQAGCSHYMPIPE